MEEQKFVVYWGVEQGDHFYSIDTESANLGDAESYAYDKATELYDDYDGTQGIGFSRSEVVNELMDEGMSYAEAEVYAEDRYNEYREDWIDYGSYPYTESIINKLEKKGYSHK